MHYSRRYMTTSILSVQHRDYMTVETFKNRIYVFVYSLEIKIYHSNVLKKLTNIFLRFHRNGTALKNNRLYKCWIPQATFNLYTNVKASLPN